MKKIYLWILSSIVFSGLFLMFAAAENSAAPAVKAVKDLDLRAKTAYSRIANKSKVQVDLEFGKFPLYFITNNGQVNEKAAFYAKASRYTLWLTKEGLVFDSLKKQDIEKQDTGERIRNTGQKKHGSTFTDDRSPMTDYHSPIYHSTTLPLTNHHSPLAKYDRDVSRLLFIGAAKNPVMVPLEEAKLKVNYFIGNDRSKWRCDIPTSPAVLYKELYKDIDLKVYGMDEQIEYDWIIKPGGNPADIKIEYKNIESTSLDDDGNLLIKTNFGELVHKKPVAYQVCEAQSKDGGASPRACPEERKYVHVTFKKISGNRYGFDVGDYDKKKELVIDPVILGYSTYLGGNDYDAGDDIAVDNSGNVYVTGITGSTDFPILDHYQADQPNYDAFITRIDPNRNGSASLIYSTYLGGNNHDKGWGIAVGGSGIVYVTGFTLSSDFPTLNQYQANQNATDGFIAKLDTNQAGAAGLLYSTYLGGSGYDWCTDIAVDSYGCAYVTGYTDSTDFPTLYQYQADQPGRDAFMTKIDTTQSGASCLLYSTYLGGGDDDAGYAIAAGSSGNVYVTGETLSTDFPCLNQYQTFQGGFDDAFVTRLNTYLSGAASLIYSTYLGGNDSEGGLGIAVDSDCHVYVTGGTYSSNFPLLNQYMGKQAYMDVYVTRLDTTKSGSNCLKYSTCLGGSSSEYGYGIALDSDGYVYITGFTESTDFPTQDQYQPDQGLHDAIVAKLDTGQGGAQSLIYSTYLGGSSEDHGEAIAVDSSDNVYVTGYTLSSNFPLLNQYQNYPGDGNRNVFVTKLFTPVTPTVTTAAVSAITAISALCGGDVTFDGGAEVTVKGVCWGALPCPTLEDNHTEDGTGEGIFISSLTGLLPNTTYNVRAYAVNSVGTAYGNEKIFTTSISSIQVTSPNGGENWEAGSVHDITWCWGGVVGYVKLEYSTDNGSNWTEIAAAAENDGSYPWTVANTLSNQCLVRVYEIDGSPLDVGDATFTISPSTAGIPANERAALIALYNSTCGDSWTNDSGWKTPPLHTDGFAMPGTESNWFGVNCDSSNTTVQSIGLSHNNLVGSIPPELGNLLNLFDLDLSANLLSGSIPQQLGSLTNLRYLWLFDNALTGDIPTQIGNLIHLEFLFLDHNQLSGELPTQLGNMTALRHLWLTQNRLTGNIPASLGNLSGLESLFLDFNSLTGNIPPEIGNLSALEILHLDANALTGGVPDSLAGLVDLTDLDIGCNGLYAAVENEALRAFLVGKDPDWESTQTTAPTGLQANVLSETSVEISWTPIIYAQDAGGYRLFYGTVPGGPFDLYGVTLDKTVSSMEVGGLTTGTPYYFVIQTRTAPHDRNQNTVNSEYSDEISANPTAINPSLTVVSPNGGENWESASLHTITWLSAGTVGDVDIDYSTDNGVSWISIVQFTQNDGSYEWRVPETPSADCLIRVKEGDSDAGPADVSDAVFSIVSQSAAAVTVTSPNGGEKWQVASIHNITWTSSGITGDIKIEYSTDRGASWGMIAPDTANDGSYGWTVPDTISDNCLVRIRADLEDDAPHDTSNAAFSIIPSTAPAITVTSPNGGEKFYAGSTYSITWKSYGSVGNIKIEYSLNNGATWSTIVDSTADTGNYGWLVPDVPSGLCLIKISETDGAPVDTSDAVFSIIPIPSITVTSPNGGESLTVGSIHRITWSSTGTFDKVTIEYSIDNGDNWTLITYCMLDGGGFDWTIPDQLSDNCLIKISGCETDEKPTDVSDGVFSIDPPL